MTEDEEKYMSECLDEWVMIDDPDVSYKEVEEWHKDKV